MMKKAISLLAALSLCITTAGAQLTTFAEENTVDTSVSVSDESTADTESSEAAEESSEEEKPAEKSETETEKPEAEETDKDDFPDTIDEIEQYAEDSQDPQYGKYMALKAEYQDALVSMNVSDFESMFGAVRTQAINSGNSNIDPYTGRELYHNPRFDDYDKIFGVDVSMFQYNIDWNKVKADGISFAIIRLGYRGWGRAGTLCLDPYFVQNMRGAAAAGVDIGIYFYTQAITVAEAKEEADFCLGYLRSYNIQMPVYFDMEGVDETDQGRLDTAGLTKAQKTEICCAFCDRIISAGYKAGIYSNVYWMTYMINGPYLETKYPIWLANYTTRTSYTGKYHMWQYSSNGYVDGIPTRVDMNVDYREREAMVPIDLKAQLSGNTVILTWIDQGNSDCYEVFKVNGSNYSRVNVVFAPSCSINVTDQVDKYVVRAVKTMNGGRVSYSDYSETISLSNKMITNFKASADTKKANLSWDALSGAAGYVIYRAENGGSFTEIATTTATAYKDKIKGGKKFSYKVAPYFGSQTSRTVGAETLAAHVLVKPLKVSSVSQKTASAPSSEIKIKFSRVANASGYQIAVYDASAARYDIVASVASNISTYTIDTIPANSKRSIAVRAFSEVGGLRSEGKWSNVVDCYTAPAAPRMTKVTVTPSAVKAEWTASAGASKYTVYKKNGSTFVKVGETADTFFNFHDAASANMIYAVTASYKKGSKTYTSSLSSALAINGTLPAEVVITGSSSSNNNVKLEWNAVPGVTGYRIYKRDPATGKYKSIKTVNARNTSCTITGVTERMSRFKIKAFRRETNGTVWGYASSAQTVYNR